MEVGEISAGTDKEVRWTLEIFEGSVIGQFVDGTERPSQIQRKLS